MKLDNVLKRELRLSELNTGEAGVIIKVNGEGSFHKRITEMGFVRGKIIKVIKNAPLQDPVEYEIMGYKVSLRRNEANNVEVIQMTDTMDESSIQNNYEGTIDENTLKISDKEKTKIIKVALVGNPNSGKTTLFNYASGSHERIGNYGGVTVDAKEAKFKSGKYSFHITDLPGTYSITEYSPEELFVRRHITDSKPDIIVNVVDASNLERNLFLTTQLIDMNIKVVIALNMYDELEKKGIKFDYTELGKMLGIPIIPTVAAKGKGIDELFNKLIDVYEDRDPIVRHIHINYGNNIEESIRHLQQLIRENKEIKGRFSTRYLSIKLLEGDNTSLTLLESCKNFDKIKKTKQFEIRKLEKEYSEKSETILTDAKYGFIAGALKELKIENPDKIGTGGELRKEKRNIDDVITHKVWGFPIFIILMWLMFEATFSLGKYPMELIQSGVSIFSLFVKNILPDGALRDLLVDGIIGGVGSVIVFLPNILILFFCISLMEDTGYMARAAFITDKLMHKIGLHGKSFIPLVMGFGCNVPAIMATRTLENKKDRILTMLILPFMSCSARLPVYILLISAFFPYQQGLVLFTIYITGIVLAIILALIMKNTVFSKQDAPFVMELPPYRIPTLRNTGIHMWHKGVQYLKKMGNVILLASIIIWALGYYPHNIKLSKDYDNEIRKAESMVSLDRSEKAGLISKIEINKESERQEKSYIGMIGHSLEPLIRPLGFDWKIGVSIFTGLAAKEVVVSTMGILYHVKVKDGESSDNLKEKLILQKYSEGKLKGQNVFTPLVALTLMLFVLIYFPCVATIAAIRKESSMKWAVFTMVYTTSLAWIVAFLTYQIGSLFI